MFLNRKPTLQEAKPAEPEYPLWRFPVRAGKIALGWADGPVDEATGLAGSIKGIDSQYRSTHFYAVGALRARANPNSWNP